MTPDVRRSRPPRPAGPGLAYFDLVLHDFDNGKVGRNAHFGHWDDPTERPGSLADVEAAMERMNEVVIDLLGARDGHVVVDVGCGLGGPAAAIARRHHDLHVIGINIDHRQLDRCAQLIPEPGTTFSWVEADACSLPLGAGTVDRLLCVEAMPHFGSRAEFFAESARILQPGGVLVVADILLSPEAPSALELSPGSLAELIDAEIGPWPDPLATLESVDEAARRHGLRGLERIDATAATLPTHTLSYESIGVRSAGQFPDVVRGGRLLSWLHEQRLIGYHYLSFVKV